MRGNRRCGSSAIRVSASRWLLWLARRIAGPSIGSRSPWRRLTPSTIATSGRTTPRKKASRSSRDGARASVIAVPDGMEEQGRGVGQAVEPVEHPAMAGQQRAGVLDAEIALDRRDGDVAEEAGDADAHSGRERARPVE